MVFIDLEICIDLCLYIFPLFIFFVFAKKSSPNINLQMKRDIELQKPVAHTNIRLGKRESYQKLKCMIVQKAKGYPIKGKYQKAFSQWDVIVSKRSNDGVKCYHVLWEVIYAYFYNWDGSHDLVLIVYALVELIIEASH